MEYQIKYGSSTAIDQLGFVRKGNIKISDESIELSGNKHWSPWVRVVAFLFIGTILSAFYHNLAWFIIALVIEHYFCTSKRVIKLNKSEIIDINRSGVKITFKVPMGNKSKRSLFRAKNEKEAIEIQSALK